MVRGPDVVQLVPPLGIVQPNEVAAIDPALVPRYKVAETPPPTAASVVAKRKPLALHARGQRSVTPNEAVADVPLDKGFE
jgi:hypothetical protein